ncbi:MAG: DedA family protein [Chlorobi bacterium]|nr:DedA family protein [Chlorobiota bacterium]
MADYFEYGYLTLFIVSFVAATVVPLSSEALYIFMLSAGYSIPGSLFFAVLGNWLGGMTGYYLGFFTKWEWINKYLGIKKDKIERSSIKIKKYGSVAAFFCWLPFIGDLIGVVLGIIRSNVWMVAIFMFAGKLFRYLLLSILFIKGISYF